MALLESRRVDRFEMVGIDAVRMDFYIDPVPEPIPDFRGSRFARCQDKVGTIEKPPLVSIAYRRDVLGDVVRCDVRRVLARRRMIRGDERKLLAGRIP